MKFHLKNLEIKRDKNGTHVQMCHVTSTHVMEIKEEFWSFYVLTTMLIILMEPQFKYISTQ